MVVLAQQHQNQTVNDPVRRYVGCEDVRWMFNYRRYEDEPLPLSSTSDQKSGSEIQNLATEASAMTYIAELQNHGRGYVADEYNGNVRSVLLVRQDRKNQYPQQARMLSGFCPVGLGFFVSVEAVFYKGVGYERDDEQSSFS